MEQPGNNVDDVTKKIKAATGRFVGGLINEGFGLDELNELKAAIHGLEAEIVYLDAMNAAINTDGDGEGLPGNPGDGDGEEGLPGLPSRLPSDGDGEEGLPRIADINISSATASSEVSCDINISYATASSEVQGHHRL